MPTDPRVRPFCKMVGGKTRLLPQLVEMLPPDFEKMHYCEPFVGGGALYFAIYEHLEWGASLSDSNAALISTYKVVRDDVEVLIEHLDALSLEHTARPEKTYAMAREAFNFLISGTTQLSATERAALFVYLNKTCFNGVYRENKRGEFNVPMGSYANPSICDAEGLRIASAALSRNVGIVDGDFQTVLRAGKFVRSFCYMDPPYAPVNAQSFTGYVRHGFSHDDQQRLRCVFGELDQAGHKLMLSNSPAAAALYDGYHIETVRATRSVNSKGSGRGLVDEIVVRNY
jgi:DNA adenine methylase